MCALLDEPLPLPGLPWQSFQRFCLSLLRCIYPDAVIHQDGGEGHKQNGIDLEMWRGEGEKWTFQVKRMKRFEPAHVRKVVEHHNVASQKKIILLSKEASGEVGDELETNPGWELWDREDLSERFRCLDPWDQDRLITTYFPGQHFALTGRL